MKKRSISLFILALLLTLTPITIASAVGISATTQVSNNMVGDSSPQVDGDHIVWVGYPAGSGEIYLYQISTSTTTQVTSNTAVDDHPQVNGDYVVWHSNAGVDFEIFLYQISTGITTQLTNNTADDAYPQVNGDYVVWQGDAGGDFEIYLYQISTGTTTQVTNNSVLDEYPQVDGNYIAWHGEVGGFYDVFYYEISTGTTGKPIVSHGYYDGPPQLDNGYITWQSNVFFSDWEICLYRIGGTLSYITNNTANDRYPQIDSDYVVWQGEADGDEEIYLYQVSTGTTTQVSNNTVLDEYPQVNGDYVVWRNFAGGDGEIYLYQISTGTTTQVTNNTATDTNPHVDGENLIWQGGADGDDEIYLARIDGIAPTVTINQAVGQADPTNGSPINFTVVFSEPVTGFDGTDVTLDGTAGATAANVTGSGTTYNVAVSGMTSAGSVIASIGDGAATDAAGNNSQASTSTDNQVTWDGIPPTVTIDQAAAQADPTNSSPINYEVVFSESVTGFDGSDVTLSGSAGAATATVTGSGTTYNVAVSGMTSDGTVIANVVANAAQDSTGNGTLASTSTDNEVTYDTTAPTVPVTTIEAAYNLRGPVSFEITFSETVYDPAGSTDLDDVTNPANYLLVEAGPNSIFDTTACSSGLSPDDTVIPINTVTYDNGTFTATVPFNNDRPLDNGHYRFFVCGTTSVTDLAGTPIAGNGVSSGTDYLVDFTVDVPDTLPGTGFAPGVFTSLPIQPAEKQYTSTSLMLEIPSLGVKQGIVGVPVVENEWDVSWLGSNIGYLSGTAFPTTEGNTVLTAHVYDSNNYPGPFAKLRSLQHGDQIKIHAWGQTYTYEVRQTRLNVASYLTYTLQYNDFDWITLITCEGYNKLQNTYAFRRVVRAVLVDVK